MPRYFFDLQNDLDAPDPDGKELPDLEAAISEARQDARELIAARVRKTAQSTFGTTSISAARMATFSTLSGSTKPLQFGAAIRLLQPQELGRVDLG